MPWKDPIGEPLIEELESLIPGLTPTKPALLSGIQTSKPFLYQTPGESENSEQLNLIETASQPQDEFSLAKADALIINKASALNSIPSAQTSDPKTNSYSRDATTSEIDPLIGKLDSDLGDPLTNPNRIISPVVTASTAFEKAEPKTPLSATAETSSKPEDNKTPLSSATTLKTESSPNQTSPATVLTTDKSEYNKTLPVTVSTSAQSESNKTSSTTAPTSDKSEFSKTLPATVSTTDTTEPKKTSPTITSTPDNSEANKTLPTITSTPDKLESNKTLPATIPTSTNSSPNKTSPATAETSDKSEPNKTSPATSLTSDNSEADKILPAPVSNSDLIEANKTLPATATLSTTDKSEASTTSPAITSTSDNSKANTTSSATASTIDKSEAAQTSFATVSTTDKSSANQPLPATASTAENAESNKTLPPTVLNTDKSSANKPSPTITSTTDKLESNKTLPAPDPTSTTDKIEPNKTSPDPTSTTDKIEPNKTLPATASTSDKSEPNKTSPTTTSTPDKSEPNKTSPTEISTANNLDNATNLELDKASTPSTNINFDSNAFLVDEKGIVGIQFTSDGGWYSGQLAIVSQLGMEKFVPGSLAFISEAASRALSNSTKGYIAMDDNSESAYYTDANSSENFNSGQYLGTKTFAMTPGDKFFFMLVPNGTIQQVYDNPAIGGDKKPLFSIATDNPSDGFSIGQIADITGEGKLFVMEDMGLIQGSDLDYDDITFRVTGATSKIIPLSQLVDPKSAAIHSQLIQKLKGESDKSEPKSPAESSATNSADKSPEKTSLITSDTDKPKPLPAATFTDSDTRKPQPTAETVANPDSQKPQLAVIVTDSDSQKSQPTAATIVNPDGKELPIITATTVTDSDSQKPQLTIVANSDGKELPPTETLTVSQPQNQESTKTGTSTVGKSPTQESPTTVTLILDKLDSKEQSPTVTLTVDKSDNQESPGAATSTVGKSPTQESPQIEQTTPNPKTTSARVNEFNSETEPQVSTESIVSQPADAELIKTDKTVTNRIPQSPVEAEDVVNDAASPSTAETTLIPTPIAFQSSTNPPTFQSITTTANLPIPGTFLVDNQGKVKFDYVFDGGSFTGEIGIFSLAGMSAFTPGTPEFIAEASRRVLSNSTDGHIVISDSIEGAKFTGSMPFDWEWGSGEYQGIKTFNMTPGDTFAVMLVPNATIQSSFQSSYSGNLFPENRPLFSISTANPNDTAHLLQIADITGSGNTFALEDMSPPNSDRDYNDLIFKISGATGNAPLLDTVINPDREWRNTPLGQQLLAEANPPNSDNNPPVVSPTSARTYTELETTISLDNLATDAEGDPLTISVLNPVNGTVIFNPLTNKASFKPAIGFSGIASFDFLASDAFGSSTPARVTVNVSDVPLLNLDFVKRNPILNAGENTELVVLGDFADQKGVVLPDSYLTYTSINPEVAPIDAAGKVTGLTKGTSILSASRNNLQAVTPIRIGTMPQPTTDAQLHQILAEMYGLDPYPDAVSLTPGATRKLSLGLNSNFTEANLTAASTGTRYFSNNSNILNVSPDGTITAVGIGDGTVTAIHGTASATIPVRVEAPKIGTTALGTDGGIINSSDGTLAVMIPPGALKQNATVSIAPVNQQNLSLPLPPGFEFAGAFNLNFGDNSLNIPAQLAVPAPAGLAPGTVAYFLRKGAIPDATGTWNSIWLQEESGIVGDDGNIRTQSPPYPGVVRPGEYAVVYSSPTGSATLVKGQLTLNYNFPLAFFGIIDPLGNIGQLIDPDKFVTTPAFTVTRDISSVQVVAIPKVGLPVVTEVGVQRNDDGTATFKAALNMPAPTSSDPTAPPVLQKAELKFKDENNQQFENNEPLLFLTGGNILVNNASDSKGSRFEDLVVEFQVGNQVYPGTILPNRSRSVGGNQFEVAVQVPNTLPLGASGIVLTRKQNQLVEQNGTAPVYKPIEYSSNPIRLPQGAEYVFATQNFPPINPKSLSELVVIKGSNPKAAVEATSSKDLLISRIPVGAKSTDAAEASAVTGDGTRVYVVLRESGGVAMVDPMVLRQVDTQPNTPGVNPIVLPAGAKPKSIAIGPTSTSSTSIHSQQRTIRSSKP